MYQSNDVEKFIEGWLEFDIQLREKKGINYKLLEELTILSEKIRKEFENEPYIPKELAGIFIDLYSATESTSYLYSEKEQQEILGIADQLTELARDICL